jgi:hypothetical protein
MGPSTFGILILLKLRKVEKHILKVKLEALMANAGTLFSKDPVIELVDLLAVK